MPVPLIVQFFVGSRGWPSCLPVKGLFRTGFRACATYCSIFLWGVGVGQELPPVKGLYSKILKSLNVPS
jgi:hypothetical protein